MPAWGGPGPGHVPAATLSPAPAGPSPAGAQPAALPQALLPSQSSHARSFPPGLRGLRDRGPFYSWVPSRGCGRHEVLRGRGRPHSSSPPACALGGDGDIDRRGRSVGTGVQGCGQRTRRRLEPCPEGLRAPVPTPGRGQAGAAGALLAGMAVSRSCGLGAGGFVGSVREELWGGGRPHGDPSGVAVPAGPGTPRAGRKLGRPGGWSQWNPRGGRGWPPRGLASPTSRGLCPGA